MCITPKTTITNNNIYIININIIFKAKQSEKKMQSNNIANNRITTRIRPMILQILLSSSLMAYSM